VTYDHLATANALEPDGDDDAAARERATADSERAHARRRA
jgi:hypothetical protein